MTQLTTRNLDGHWSLVEWAAAHQVLAARSAGTVDPGTTDRLFDRLANTCGSEERAMRFLAFIRGQEIRTGVPGTLIAEAGVAGHKPAAPALRPSHAHHSLSRSVPREPQRGSSEWGWAGRTATAPAHQHRWATVLLWTSLAATLVACGVIFGGHP